MPAWPAAYVPRASTARMHCCTKRGTGLLSRSHSWASAQPNTWSGGEAHQRRAPQSPQAPRSPGPSSTSDVALLPQRLQRGPPQQELAELVPDLAQVSLLAPRVRRGRSYRRQCGPSQSVRRGGPVGPSPIVTIPQKMPSIPCPTAVPTHTCSGPRLILPPASQALTGPKVHAAALAFLLQGQVCGLESHSLRETAWGQLGILLGSG